MSEPVPTGPTDELRVEPAAHLADAERPDPQFEQAVALLRELAVQPGAPAWISQVTNGMEDVRVYAAHVPAADRTRYTDCARLISLSTDELDELLESARTGRLVRVVVQTESADVYCMSIVPGSYVIGAQPDRAPDRDYADAADADDLLGEHVQQRRELLGGLPDRNLRGRDRGQKRPSARVPEVLAVAGTPHDAIEDILRASFAESDNDAMHWLALVTGRDVRPLLDELGEPDVVATYPLAKPDARRKVYTELAQDLPNLLGGLAHAVRDVLGNHPRSFVLDVELGVIAVHPLGATERYVVGVTLSQERVEVCETAMDKIAEVLRPTDGDRAGRTPVGAGSRTR